MISNCKALFWLTSVTTVVVVLLLLVLPGVPPKDATFDEAYKVRKTLPFEGKLALNDKLAKLQTWHNDRLLGPEAFAIYKDEIYTSLANGDIVKLTGSNYITPVAKFGKACDLLDEHICGRPLGLTFDKNGFLYATDAYYGIFKVNVKTGDIEQLIGKDVQNVGKKPKIFNSIAITSEGIIYWTDSSTSVDLANGIYDMLADPTGRLLSYDPKTGTNQVLMSKIHFANGVVLSEDEDYLLISETGRSRIHRYYIKGPKMHQHDIFLDGLPGLPDNLSRDGKGGYLVPLISTHDAESPSIIQILGPFPKLRKVVARFFAVFDSFFMVIDHFYTNHFCKVISHGIGHFRYVALIMKPERVTLLHVSATGEILDALHGRDLPFTGFSEAQIYKDNLLLGSPFQNYIATVPLVEIGWEHLDQDPKRYDDPSKVIPLTKTIPVVETPRTTHEPKPTQAPNEKTTTPAPTTTKAPKVQTPAPTQAPKPKQTTPPKQAPKPTQAPKPQDTKQATKAAPSTQVPKKTPPPTQAPKKTPPPTQAPKKTPPPTQAPKKTPPPTQAPKKTSPPTQAPKKTPPPTQAPKKTPPPTLKQAATQAPKVQTQKPKVEAPKTTTPPPATKPQTKDAPKPNPSQSKPTKNVPRNEL